MDPRENLLDHYENPRNKGTLEHAARSHELRNTVCGDQIKIEVALTDDNRIERIAFDGRGCVISQAAASMLCEAVEGRRLSEACALPGQFVLDMIGVPLSATRVKCALLALETLKRALACAQPTLVSNI